MTPIEILLVFNAFLLGMVVAFGISALLFVRRSKKLIEKYSND